MRFASIVFVAGLALLLYNYLRFGDPLQSGYSSAQNKFTLEFLRRDIADSLLTPQRGLFTFNPVLLAAIPGWFVFFRKKMPEAAPAGHLRPLVPLHGLMDELPGRMGLG